ncbi:hypothetical protein GTQ34_00115 [Muricauda sp. JGD-17]|uniref:Uncharacterized protein n=1 Tax=Flagellimonas ochracea TaxID=2696472 RepID=A0A964WW07_9FLAO|nr:hypothetical protein [Allomuricauda ochracea]NAY90308.1 hypothetical protein [Allomuricauda ochracea]
MNNQYCKVGTVTPITHGNQAIAALEFRYRAFLEKAKDATYANTKLGDFFKQKAEAFKNILDSLS